MTYLLQVSTCWIVFYGIYLLFLRRETFFSINRYYLLSTLIIGLFIPYLGAFIPANEASVEVYQMMTQFTAVEVSQQAFVEESTPIFTWMNILWSIYIVGGLVVCSRFVYGLNRIYRIYKEADKTQQTNYTLVESDKYHLPFSFFHFIFISKKLPLNDEVAKVLKHEELHANQWHSIDIVFIELLQIFFWFNPILILYKGALRQSHEYLADAYVTQDHNKNSYGQLLLQQSTSGLEIALANQFFHSQIKKRITMMYKEKSKRSAMVKYLAAVPVLVAMLIIFSSNQMGENSIEKELTNLEQKYSSLELEIREELEKKGIDIENLDHANPTEIEAVRIALDDILKSSFDFDIKVEKDGTYTFPPTTKDVSDISGYFKAIKSENRSVILDVDQGAEARYITSLLDCASNIDLEVILNKSEISQREEIELDLKTLERINAKDLGETVKREVEGYRTITVLPNGAYTHDRTPLTDQEVYQIISLIKEKEGHLYIKVIKGSKWEKVSKLMSIASQLGVKAVVENQNFPENFNGRKIIYRKWKPIVNDLSKKDGKLVIKAVANEKGEMIHVEIDENRTTIEDEAILKNALISAKGYRIEEGEGTAEGTLIFNMSEITKPNFHDEYIKEYNYGENEDKIPGIKVGQNRPNPWRQTTSFKINAEKTTNGTLNIYNVQGNIVFTKSIQLEKGDNFTKISKKDVGGKFGVYYYSLKIGGEELTRKMILVDGKEKSNDTGNVNFRLGENVPEGTVIVKVEGEILTENRDYKIDYKEGIMTMIKELDPSISVNVSFSESAKEKSSMLDLIPDFTKDNNQNDPIFKVVEEMPRFPGCEDIEGTAKEKEDCAKQKMLEYIYSNIKYPAKARDANVEGMCVVQFIIEKNGSVKGAKIVRDIGAGCGDETMKVVNSFPIWVPGKQRGEAVRVQYTLPVKFKLEGDAPKEKIEQVRIEAYGTPNEEEKKANMRHGKSTKQVQDPSVYKVVEKMPQFVGCEEVVGEDGKMGCSTCAKGKMLEFIYTNLKYPKEARAKGIDGMAVVQFIVNKDGTISDANVIRNPGGGTGEEAKRVVEMMPTWIPGEQGGKKVKVVYTLPVKFKLEGDEKVKEIIQEKKETSVKTHEESVGNKVPKKSTITLQELKSLKSIDPWIKEYKDKDCKVETFRIVVVNPKEDALVHFNDGVNLETVSKNILKQAKVGGWIFMEGIIMSCPSVEGVDPFNIALSVTADVEDLLEGKMTGVDITKSEKSNIILKSIDSKDQQPLFVVDGNVRFKKNIELLDPDDIESVTVLKDQKAIDKYGSQGENGVIEITLKKNKSRKLNPTKFVVSPNPSDGKLNIEYQLDKNIPVSLMFFNVEGKTLKKMLNLPAENIINVDFSNHKDSIIYISIEQDGKTETRKVIMQR